MRLNRGKRSCLKSMRARSVPETVQTNDSLANCRERKQTTRIHVNQTKPANSCILWKATGNLGCKRSRVQIPAARPATNPTNTKTYPTRESDLLHA